MLKPLIGLVHGVNLLPRSDVTSCIAHLEITGSVNYTDLSRIDVLLNNCFKNHIKTLVTSPERTMSVGKLSRSWWWISFPKFKFYHWQHILSVFLRWLAYFLISAKSRSLYNHSLPCLPFEYKGNQWKKHPIQIIHKYVLFLKERTIAFQFGAEVPYLCVKLGLYCRHKLQRFRRVLTRVAGLGSPRPPVGFRSS